MAPIVLAAFAAAGAQVPLTAPPEPAPAAEAAPEPDKDAKPAPGAPAQPPATQKLETGIPFLDGLLKDVPVDVPVEDDTSGWPVLQPGQPRPLIALKFEYANPLAAHFSDKSLRAMVHSKIGEPISPALLDEDAEYIADQHRIRGYMRTQVLWALDQQPNGDIITFFMKPGPRAKLTRIEVHGNSAVDDAALLKGMKHQPAGPLVLMMGFNPLNMLQKDASGYYNPAYLEEDKRTLLKNLEGEGYFDARITGTSAVAVRNEKPFLRMRASVGNSPDEEVTLVFSVMEGQRYKLGRLVLTGDLPDTEANVRRLVEVAPGAPARMMELDAGAERILDAWRNQGHHGARVVTTRTLDRSLRTVDMEMQFIKGPVARVGKITFKHQNPIFFLPDTRQHVIRRDLAFSEGSRYSARALKISEERLLFTGLFTRVVLTAVATEDPGVVDVEIDVTEQPGLLFNLAPAWVPGEGPLGFLLLGTRNMFGMGWRANFQGMLSPRRFTLRLDGEEPRVLNSRLSLGLNLHRDRWVYPEFALTRLGGAAVLGYPLLERLFFSLSGTAELVDLDPSYAYRVEAYSGTARFPFNRRRHAVRMDVVYDQRDNMLFPTRGFFLSASAEYGGALVLGEIPFLSVSANARFYIPLIRGFVLKNNTAVAGVMNPNGGPVPISERFYEGGPFQSVRGYGFQSISPIVTVGDAADPGGDKVALRMGGVSRFLNNVELEFPAFDITPEFPLKAYVFLDAGNTWSEYERPFFLPRPWAATRDGVWLPGGLFYGAGIGAMLVTPLFPMRIEAAFPIPITRRQQDQSLPPPFVSVGSSF